ncbi:putative chromosome-partitioning protein ParB [Pseudoclavibacter triregionum]|nr:putative chromosome-partitioning protein ParB [Pseudoclavibacter triregionum]
MATKKRSGLGRGIGALIPTKPAEPAAAAYPARPDRSDRPVDVFFPGTQESTQADAHAGASGQADAGKPATRSSAAAALLGELDGPARAAAARRASSRSGGARGAARGKATGTTAAAGAGRVDAGSESPIDNAQPAEATTAEATTAKPKRAKRATVAAAIVEEKAAEAAAQLAQAARGGEAATGAPGAVETEEREEGMAAAASGSGAVAEAAGDVGASGQVAEAGDAPDFEPFPATDADTVDLGDDVSDDADAETDGPELVEVPGIRLIELDPRRVAPNLKQPRHEFDEDALAELTTSVREFGVLQPIVVRSIPADHPSADRADYELIMGERRLRASRAAGLDAIPAIVREAADEDMLRDALLENIHRAELNPLEEASAYQQLLDDFGITQEELAQRIGRSRPQISNTIRLLKLPVEVQRRVAAGVLSAGHARAILSVGEPAAMTQLADKIVNEDLSVRAAEAAASKQASTRPGAGAPRKKTGGLTGYLDDCAERLGDRLNTRVRISLRKTKGQIVIDFAAVNDLNRILADLGVDVGE